MKRKVLIAGIFATALLAILVRPTAAKGDDFGAVVRVIEHFYHVKHAGIPFLARAGIKTARTAARIAGGTAKRVAEAGSVKVAYFEDQEFNSQGRFVDFRASLTTLLTESWIPLTQVFSGKGEEQNYIFLREDGEKFDVLVITIGQREATVVQVTLSPKTLVLLMQDPEEMGKTITDDATLNDPE